MQSYTYIHRTPDTNDVFYVGKGMGKRAYLSENRNRWWHNKVNKHGGFVVEIVAGWPTELEALEHEKFLIDCFEGIGTVLTNIQKAIGRETKGRKLTAETCQRMSEAGKKRWLTLTEEMKIVMRDAVSQAIKGKKKTEAHRKKLSESRQGLKVPSIWKPVFCKTTNTIFNSVTEAANQTGCDPSHIVKCCKGKLKHTKKMEFTYG